MFQASRLGGKGCACLGGWGLRRGGRGYLPRMPPQNLPDQIRGTEHPGHQIPRSDVLQKAKETRPNPRYRQIGHKIKVSTVRADYGPLYPNMIVEYIV